MIRLLLASLTFACVAAPARADVACAPPAEVRKMVDDDLCEAFRTGTDRCYATLARAFYGVKDFPARSTEERRKLVNGLKMSHAAGARRLKQYQTELRTLGQGKACLDAIEYVDEFIKAVDDQRTKIERF